MGEASSAAVLRFAEGYGGFSGPGRVMQIAPGGGGEIPQEMKGIAF